MEKKLKGNQLVPAPLYTDLLETLKEIHLKSDHSLGATTHNNNWAYKEPLWWYPCTLKNKQEKIKDILYAQEKERKDNITHISSSQYSIIFTQAILICWALKNPITLTKRKLYEQYYQALIKHATEQFRLFSESLYTLHWSRKKSI